MPLEIFLHNLYESHNVCVSRNIYVSISDRRNDTYTRPAFPMTTISMFFDVSFEVHRLHCFALSSIEAPTRCTRTFLPIAFYGEDDGFLDGVKLAVTKTKGYFWNGRFRLWRKENSIVFRDDETLSCLSLYKNERFLLLSSTDSFQCTLHWMCLWTFPFRLACKSVFVRYW